MFSQSEFWTNSKLDKSIHFTPPILNAEVIKSTDTSVKWRAFLLFANGQMGIYEFSQPGGSQEIKEIVLNGHWMVNTYLSEFKRLILDRDLTHELEHDYQMPKINDFHIYKRNLADQSPHVSFLTISDTPTACVNMFTWDSDLESYGSPVLEAKDLIIHKKDTKYQIKYLNN